MHQQRSRRDGNDGHSKTGRYCTLRWLDAVPRDEASILCILCVEPCHGAQKSDYVKDRYVLASSCGKMARRAILRFVYGWRGLAASPRLREGLELGNRP